MSSYFQHFFLRVSLEELVIAHIKVVHAERKIKVKN